MMKKLYTMGSLMTLVLLLSLTACHDMKVGYLQTENASYTPDTVYAYRNPAEDDNMHYEKDTPWLSPRIQGVAGTNPINYKYYSVKVKEGGDAGLFVQAVQNGEIQVQGAGLILLFPSAVGKLPDGIYTLSIRVYNEDHSDILEDAFTYVVKDLPGDEYQPGGGDSWDEGDW